MKQVNQCQVKYSPQPNISISYETIYISSAVLNKSYSKFQKYTPCNSRGMTFLNVKEVQISPVFESLKLRLLSS